MSIQCGENQIRVQLNVFVYALSENPTINLKKNYIHGSGYYLKKLSKSFAYFRKIIIQDLFASKIFFRNNFPVKLETLPLERDEKSDYNHFRLTNVLARKLEIISLLSCLVLATILAGSVGNAAPVIYVAGDGSGDFNCDGKADQVEINQALQFVAKNPGYTTVHLKGPFTYTINNTIYVESNTILEGDSDAIVKLVDHAGWTNTPMIPMIGQRDSLYKIGNVTVRGFEIYGNNRNNTEIPYGKGYYNMIFFKHANNVTVNNMYFHDGHGDGLRIYYGENVKFYNNRVSLLGHDGMYTINATNVEAWNNKITCRINSGLRVLDSNNVKLHNNFIDSYPDAGPGIQVQRSEGNMKNIEIYDNLITNTWGPGIWVVGTQGEYDKSLSDCHIHHNTFIGSGSNKNIEWVGGVLGSGFHNVLIENNVFDGVYNAAVVNMYMSDTNPGPSGTGFTTTVRNNIIVNTVPRNTNGKNTGYGVSNCLPNSHTIVLQNNCLYNNSKGNYKNCSSTTDIYCDPLFADRKNNDYHLKSVAGRWNGKTWVNDDVSSPCIDAGYPSSDYSNEPTPNGKRINIGRYGNTIFASKSESSSTPILPTASFSSNVTSGDAPLSVKFTDLSKNATSWNWDFGDGTTSTLQNPQHIYSTAGNYTVTLSVSNKAGSGAKVRPDYIQVSPSLKKPVVSFWGSRTSGNAPLTVYFTDNSTNSPTSWNWDFGDGTTSTLQKPQHTYSTAGNYTVTLSASNTAGTGTKTRPDYIKVK